MAFMTLKANNNDISEMLMLDDEIFDKSEDEFDYEVESEQGVSGVVSEENQRVVLVSEIASVANADQECFSSSQSVRNGDKFPSSRPRGTTVRSSGSENVTAVTKRGGNMTRRGVKRKRNMMRRH
jgi:hypothetical protein